MEPKYIFFNELELDSEHRISLNIRENENNEQIYFFWRKSISSRIRRFCKNRNRNGMIMGKL